MRILVLSDIHGKTETLDCLRSHADTIDMVIAAGDLTHFGNLDDAGKVIAVLKEIHPKLMAIAGNCDNREIEKLLLREGLAPGPSGFDKNGMRILGLSGALPGPINTPYEETEEALAAKLKALDPGPSERVVLVSHQPPHGTVADRVMKMKHVGSRSLREWVDQQRPLLVICGHIHESYGHSMTGPSHVLNPGAFKDGRYALVDIGDTDGRVEIQMLRCDN